MLWLKKLWRNGFLMYKHVMPIFLLLLMYFITHIKWEMLSFLHRWDYCWKCEFDTDVKIENCNHHDGEQLFFLKKYISRHRAKRRIFLWSLYYCFKMLYIIARTKNQIYLIKLYSRETSRERYALIQHEQNWLGWIVIEQINYK